jgi:pilus assembly protein Flp/PilA
LVTAPVKDQLGAKKFQLGSTPLRVNKGLAGDNIHAKLYKIGRLEQEPTKAAMYATVHLVEGFSPMLKYYVKTREALKRLPTDERGVVSFEYIIVAFCVVAAVAAVFGTGTTTGIGGALNTAMQNVLNQFAAAVPAP